MASTALDLIAQGKRELKNIPLNWFVSSGIGTTGKELPQALPSGWTDPGGLQQLDQNQAIERMKSVIPYDTAYLKDRVSSTRLQEIGNEVGQQLPGIKAGESYYDWLQRTDVSTTKGDHSLAKQFLTDPTNTFDPNNVQLNGQFYDRKTAEKLMGMTLEEAQKQSLAESQLKTKMQGEQSAEAARLAQIKSFQDQGKQIPQELLAPGQGAGNASSTPPVSSSFKPTEYSNTAKLSDLQKNVMDTNASLNANDAFINGVFKAFHNRDATKQELEAYRGKKVSDVRTEVIGGAQAAGLPTVAPGTIDIPTGMMTKEEALKQGLTKVQRPDQLSAFREDQIVRDNMGGIWLNTETTTQAQKDAVASGINGKQISSNHPTISDKPISASEIDQTKSNPDPTALDGFKTGNAGSSGLQAETITKVANDYLDSALAGYDKLLTAYQTKLTASQAGMDTLTSKITAMSKQTPNADALAAAKKAEGLQAKQDTLMSIKKQIATEQQKLQLGLANEQNKLAPLSIIGSRQATLQSQGLARIGALTAMAQIEQEDLAFAKDMVNATVSAINADRKEQMDALDTLVTLKDKEIVRLTDEESAVVKARQTALQSAIDSAQKNADKVFDLIKDNTGAALKAGVSLSDSPAKALSKMAPYMSKTSDLKTQIVDLGGKKVLINSETGVPIKEFTEVKAPGTGTGEKFTDVTRDDGSKVRVFLDSTGRPTGEEVKLAGADQGIVEKQQQEEATKARTDAATYVEQLDQKKISWAGAWNAMKTKYPNAANESIDAALNKTKYGKVK